MTDNWTSNNRSFQRRNKSRKVMTEQFKPSCLHCEQLRADVATLSRALNGLAKQPDYADKMLATAHAQENDALENRP